MRRRGLGRSNRLLKRAKSPPGGGHSLQIDRQEGKKAKGERKDPFSKKKRAPWCGVRIERRAFRPAKTGTKRGASTGSQLPEGGKLRRRRRKKIDFLRQSTTGEVQKEVNAKSESKGPATE